ncbi:MAG: ribonuclease catalytic domain-containing protein, partial [Thermodesulfobacteriota bacterium]|nr:ribonuclease catalytic domain-containing protein [Thermodesulfobacteriota bacterium]
MNQGKIIEYIDKGKFVCTFCIQDRGNKLHLLTTSNREINLSPKRAFLISGTLINTLSPREELLKILKRTEELRIGLMKEVHVKEIWELTKDENESFDYRYLAQLCFGEIVTDDHISALVRALFEDRLYFRMKEERFLPNSEAIVDQILRQREEDALREEQLSQGGHWLKGVLRGENISEPSHKKDIIKLLVEVALYGKEAPEYKFGKDLFLRAEISDIEQARKLLIMLNVWEEDENLDLIRLGIRSSFNEKLLIEAEQLSKIQIKSTGGEDLRDLDVITIDGPSTRDFDDALSLEIKEDTFHLGIHIADVVGIIPPYSPLDLEAFQRGASVYLPRRQIPMIPPRLSQDTLSLKQDSDRAAISLMSRFDKDGNLLDYRFIPSLIRVKRQLTYDEVNDLFINKSPFKEMIRLSQIMRQKRIDRGALILSLPEVSFEIKTNSSISLKMIDQDTPSRMIVAEFMIFYNWMAARFCQDNNIPILYRGQEGPSE